MPKALTISLALGIGYEGIDLYAQVMRADGTNITSLLSDGFADLGQGFYLWDYSNFPENFRGGVKFFNQTNTSEILAFTDVNTSTDCLPKSFVVSLNLGLGYVGVSLYAQICRADGTNFTSLLTDGFYEVGNGYYLWEYNNLPQNFRGAVKFYDQSNPTEILSFIQFSTETVANVTSCDDCIYNAGETFDITYSDQSGLNFYAILFSATDLTKAFKLTTNDFDTYTTDTHTDFVIPLSEDANRYGWYTYYISNLTNIPNVIGDQYYFLEVWLKRGSVASRLSDTNTGNMKVCWGRNNSDWLQIAQQVWEYNTRTLTNIEPTITPKEIWEYATRTLTSDVGCDYTELEKTLLAAIAISTGKTLEELAAVNSELGTAIDNTFKLLQQCCNPQTATTPKPQISPLGTKTSNSKINFK
jgi:hypothetical protein